MFASLTRTTILNTARTPFSQAVAARSARAFIATSALRKTSQTIETQQTIAERARKHRPVSPHLSIYQPQMSWVLSSLHRVTGLSVAGAAYLYTAAFGLAPMFGLDMSSAAVVSALANYVPWAVLIGAKAAVSGFLSFHCFNGFRHLWWDLGKSLNNKAVIVSGYVTLTATALATGYLTFF